MSYMLYDEKSSAEPTPIVSGTLAIAPIVGADGNNINNPLAIHFSKFLNGYQNTTINVNGDIIHAKVTPWCYRGKKKHIIADSAIFLQRRQAHVGPYASYKKAFAKSSFMWGKKKHATPKKATVVPGTYGIIPLVGVDHQDIQNPFASYFLDRMHGNRDTFITVKGVAMRAFISRWVRRDNGKTIADEAIFVQRVENATKKLPY